MLNIRTKMGALAIDSDDEDRPYLHSFCNLYHNLTALHQALPGDDSQKEVKIYWSKGVEEQLIPHLFTAVLDLNQMLFVFIPGRSVASTHFQASEMQNFQLQFVTLEKDEVWCPSLEVVVKLEEEILGVVLRLIVSRRLHEVFLPTSFMTKTGNILSWRRCSTIPS